MRQVFYAHGFASSPQSSKVRFLRERLNAIGVDLHCPDFNEPDFETLTISRMIDQLTDAIAHVPAGPVALIGSSLGAFVAIFAAMHPRRETSSTYVRSPSASTVHPVDRLVLLAPALDFSLKNDKQIGPAALAGWRDTGSLDVFHYGFGEMRPVGYGLYADAQRYDPFHADLRVPTLIVQGRRDESVDPDMVERFAATRPNVTLRMVDDDHQLLGSLELIWHETARFLDLA